MQHVYFPLTGIVSLITTVDGHKPLAVGLIGSEGMLGATLGLDSAVAPLNAVVQSAGTALRIKTGYLRRELISESPLSRILNRYLHVLILHLTQAAACQRFHQVDTRVAHWLLTTHDRTHADHFYLTHALLADMLGVRRSAVTIAAGELQRRKLIRYARGEIDILNRSDLEGVSCGCYKAFIRNYARFLK